MRRASWNVMKPRIQCVLTPWVNVRFQCVRRRTDLNDQLKLTGNPVLVMLM